MSKYSYIPTVGGALTDVPNIGVILVRREGRNRWFARSNLHGREVTRDGGRDAAVDYLVTLIEQDDIARQQARSVA